MRARTLTRFIIKFSGTLALGVTLASIVFLNTTIPEKTFKKFLQFNLSKRMNQNVTFEKVSGNFISEVSLKGLKIVNPKDNSPIFEAKEIELSYSLIDIILSLGYVPNAVKEITIRNGNFYLERDKEGLWSLRDFGGEKQPKLIQKFPNFEGKIKLEKFTLHYKDWRGWGDHPIANPFSETIDSLSGDIQFKEKNPAILSLNGILTSTKAPVHLEGFLYPNSVQYDLDFTIQKMNLDQWGPYVLPFEGFHAYKNTVSLQGNIRSKEEGASEKIPFWYDLHFTLKNSELKIPFLENPITNISGKVTIFYGTLNTKIIQTFIPSFSTPKAQALLNELHKKKVIKENGQILSKIPKKLKLDQRWNDISPILETIIHHPYSKTEFQNLNGKLGNLPAHAHGEIQMNYTPSIYLYVENKHAKLETLETAFSGLSHWQMNGNSSLEFTVSGKLASPKLSGKVYSNSAQIANISASNIRTEFEIQHTKLLLSMPKITFMNNPWAGHGTVDLSSSTLQLEFKSNAFSLESIPIGQPYLKGTSHLTVNLSGKAPTLDITISGESNNAKILEQPIQKLSAQLFINSSTSQKITGKLESNKKEGVISLSGKIIEGKTVELSFQTNHYPIYDPYAFSEKKAPGELSLSGALSMDLHSKQNHTFSPLQSLVITFNAALSNTPVYGEVFNSIKTQGKFENGLLNLISFQAKNKDEDIVIKGVFDKNGPVNASIALKNVPSNYNWIQKFIPEKYKPFNGILSVNTILRQNKNTPKYPFVKGSITIENGCIFGQNFNELISTFESKGTGIEIHKMVISQDISKILLKGFASKETLDINILNGTQIDLDEFTTLTSPYGNFRGLIQGSAHIGGSIFFPKIEADFKTLNLHTTFQTFDKIEGHISYDSPLLKIQSMVIESNQNKYTLQGQWDIKSISQKQKNERPPYMFKLNIEKGQIQTFLSILDTLYSEFKFHNTYEKIQPEKIINPNITVAAKDENGRLLLFEQGNPTTVLELFYQKANQISPIETYHASEWVNALKGNLYGELSIIGNPNGLPILNANLQISDVKWKKFNAKTLIFTITPNSDQMEYQLACNQGELGPIAFSEMTSSGKIDSEGMLWINHSNIKSDTVLQKDILTGQLPLSPFWDPSTKNTPMKLELHLEGNQASLLALVIPTIQDISNEGTIQCDITGSLSAPQFNTTALMLKNTIIHFEPNHVIFNAPVHIPSANLVIKNNILTISKLPFYWEQPTITTLRLKNNNPPQNKGQLTGQLELKKLNIMALDSIVLNTDLHLEQTEWVLANSNFKGVIGLSNTSLIGEIEIPLSDERHLSLQDMIEKKQESGPMLTSVLTIKDSVLTLGNNASSTSLPMLNLDLTSYIRKNIEVNGNFVGSGFLSGISTHFEFDEKESPIKISGTLNHPFIHDMLTIKNGTINLFNRSFKLLTTQEQKRYQPPGQTNQRPNSITFFPYNSTEGISPILNLSGASIIERNQSITTNIAATQTAPYTHAVLTIDGASTALKEFRFDIFESTSPQTFTGSLVYKTTYYIPINTSEALASQRESDTRQVIQLLMPEIFAENQSTSQEILTQIGENKINMLVRQEVLRPIEKQIASRVGLYDLRIDYNLGSDIFRRTDTTRREVGINVIQRLVSDQLFLRVRTDIDLESDRQKSHDAVGVSEIELSYFLLKKRNMSINYANIKDPTIRSDYHPKLSLRFSHEF